MKTYGQNFALTHWTGVKLKISRLNKIDRTTCTDCKTCVTNFLGWATGGPKDKSAEINYHGCDTCGVCTKVCPTKAISYEPAKQGPRT